MFLIYVRVCVSDTKLVYLILQSLLFCGLRVFCHHFHFRPCASPETVPKTEPLPVRLFESGLNGPLANIAELLVKEDLARFKEG